MSDYLQVDELSYFLGLIAASVFLLRSLYKPQSLVHPILLGRQSDVSRVRNPGESAVYRNYGTGMVGRLPLRPGKDVHTLTDLVKPDFDAPRTLWNTKITNPQLKERVANVGTGLIRAAGLAPGESNVMLLLNDSIEFLITDLALASHAIASFTLSSISLLSPALESHPPSAIITNAHFLHQLVELLYDAHAEGESHTIIVLGEPDAKHTGIPGLRIIKWSDIEAEGARADKVPPQAPSPNDVFTVSFFENARGQLQSAHFTHQNITAGVAGVLALFPPTQPSETLSALDTVVSAHPLSTAFGRAVAYAALYEGANFATLESTKILPATLGQPVKEDVADILGAKAFAIPSPTVLFLKTPHIRALTEAVHAAAKQGSLAYGLALRHKIAGVREGHVSKDSLWDRLVFDGARVKLLGDAAGTVRSVIVAGGSPLEASFLTPARIALSVPFVHAHAHALVAGPVFASHALDVQSFDAPAPVGPPACNVEAKLAGVVEQELEAGGDPQGALLVRGPPVGRLVDVGEGGNVLSPQSPVKRAFAPAEQGGEAEWVGTGEMARVMTNGCFKVWAGGK